MTPRLTLSIADLRAASACGLDKRITDLRVVLPDVADSDAVDVRIWWALPSTSPADAIWSLRAARPPESAAAVAVLVARCAAARAGDYANAAGRAANAAVYAANAAAAAANAAVYAAGDVAAAAANAAYRAANAAAAAANAAGRAANAATVAAERAAQRADLIAALEAAPPSDQEREK
jgi:hypothetical protein